MKYIVLIGLICCVSNFIISMADHNSYAAMGWVTAALFALNSFVHYVS